MNEKSCKTCDWWRENHCAFNDERADYEEPCKNFSEWVPKRHCIKCGSPDVVVEIDGKPYCDECYGRNSKYYSKSEILKKR